MQVYGQLAAHRAGELQNRRVPIVDEELLKEMLSACNLPSESLAAVICTLESYGFLKQLRMGQLLVDPISWMTMVIGEFLHPVQALPMSSSEDLVPVLSLSEATRACSSHLELPSSQVLENRPWTSLTHTPFSHARLRFCLKLWRTWTCVTNSRMRSSFLDCCQ
jgi:hypothetical protein